MRRLFVAGNWKMNGSTAGIRTLVEGLLSGVGDVQRAEIAVCPPYPYIDQVARALAGSALGWGGQNLCQYAEAGAYTGEVSATMLRDLGCRFVIVGHSERRTLYAESDQWVAEKFVVGAAAGLIPILCVGELLEEREQGQTEAVIARQLDAVFDADMGLKAFSTAVIAYEPVWAIGTGKTATPEQAQAVHAFIRDRIAARDRAIADKIRILYGGSVNGANAAELFNMQDIDGGLIGGASLKPDEFLRICHAADQVTQ